MDKYKYKLFINYDLDLKIRLTKKRIIQFYEYYNGNVYISFSGGKDSTVLLDIARSIYPDIPAVFIDTGMEFPEVRDFVKTYDNITWVKPKLTFLQVVDNYGFPVVSKENSNYLYDIRTGTDYMKDIRINGNINGRFKLSKKYHYLIDAPFKISHKCCNIMKKDPVKKFEKLTGLKPIVGSMVQESNLRTQSYLRDGCNSFKSTRTRSMPLGFWNEQDILEYVYTKNLPISSVYGEVKK